MQDDGNPPTEALVKRVITVLEERSGIGSAEKPVTGAVLELYERSERLKCGKTSSKGRCGMQVPPGRYLLDITHPDYRPKTVGILVKDFDTNTFQEVPVELTPWMEDEDTLFGRIEEKHIVFALCVSPLAHQDALLELRTRVHFACTKMLGQRRKFDIIASIADDTVRVFSLESFSSPEPDEDVDSTQSPTGNAKGVANSTPEKSKSFASDTSNSELELDHTAPDGISALDLQMMETPPRDKKASPRAKKQSPSRPSVGKETTQRPEHRDTQGGNTVAATRKRVSAAEEWFRDYIASSSEAKMPSNLRVLKTAYGYRKDVDRIVYVFDVPPPPNERVEIIDSLHTWGLGHTPNLSTISFRSSTVAPDEEDGEVDAVQEPAWYQEGAQWAKDLTKSAGKTAVVMEEPLPRSQDAALRAVRQKAEEDHATLLEAALAADGPQHDLPRRRPRPPPLANTGKGKSSPKTKKEGGSPKPPPTKPGEISASLDSAASKGTPAVEGGAAEVQAAQVEGTAAGDSSSAVDDVDGDALEAGAETAAGEELPAAEAASNE